MFNMKPRNCTLLSSYEMFDPRSRKFLLSDTFFQNILSVTLYSAKRIGRGGKEAANKKTTKDAELCYWRIRWELSPRKFIHAYHVSAAETDAVEEARKRGRESERYRESERQRAREREREVK